MIPIEHYTLSYTILLSGTILFTCLPLLFKDKVSEFPKINLMLGTFLVLFITISFIGFRNPFAHSIYLGDTGAYTRTYILIQQDIMTEFNKDVGFYIFMKVCSTIMNIQGFYFVSALLYVGLPFLTFKKWFGKYAFFALAAFVSAMSFWSFGINGVRNGLASSIFIFALGNRNKKWLLYGMLVLSITFHKSMLLPAASFIIASYYKNTKVLILFWVMTIPVSLLAGRGLESILGDLLSGGSPISDGRADIYFSGKMQNLGYTQRFRWDFLLYSAIPVLVGWWFLIKRKLEDSLFQTILNMYIISNGIWILLIYVPFTDRLAYLSWFLMPIILVYPYILQSKTKQIALILTALTIFSILTRFGI